MAAVLGGNTSSIIALARLRYAVTVSFDGPRRLRRVAYVGPSAVTTPGANTAASSPPNALAATLAAPTAVPLGQALGAADGHVRSAGGLAGGQRVMTLTVSASCLRAPAPAGRGLPADGVTQRRSFKASAGKKRHVATMYAGSPAAAALFGLTDRTLATCGRGRTWSRSGRLGPIAIKSPRAGDESP